jgi:hypothetical protein
MLKRKTKPPLSKKLIAFGRVIHQDTQTVSDYSQKNTSGHAPRTDSRSTMQSGNNETPTPSLLATVDETSETLEMGPGDGRLLFMIIVSLNLEVEPVPVYRTISRGLTLNEVRRHYREATGTPEAFQMMWDTNGQIEYQINQGSVLLASDSGDTVVDVVNVQMEVGNLQVWGMDSLHPNRMSVMTRGTFQTVALHIDDPTNNRVFTVWTKEECHGLEMVHELDGNYDRWWGNDFLDSPVDVIDCANIAGICAIQVYSVTGGLICLVYTKIVEEDKTCAASWFTSTQFPCMGCSMDNTYETDCDPSLRNISRREVIVHFDEVRRQITILIDEDHTGPKKMLTIRDLPIGDAGFDGRMSVDAFDGVTPLAPRSSPILRPIGTATMDAIARLVCGPICVRFDLRSHPHHCRKFGTVDANSL